MPFDTKKFLNATYTDRTKRLEFEDKALAQYYENGEKPYWKIRGLDGQELAECNEAALMARDRTAIADALVSGAADDKKQAVRELLGMVGDVPPEHVRKLEMFRRGSVDPQIDHPFAVRFARDHPIEFLHIVGQITELTGAGRMPGKQEPCGKTRKSAAPLPSGNT